MTPAPSTGGFASLVPSTQLSEPEFLHCLLSKHFPLGEPVRQLIGRFPYLRIAASRLVLSIICIRQSPIEGRKICDIVQAYHAHRTSEKREVLPPISEVCDSLNASAAQMRELRELRGQKQSSNRSLLSLKSAPGLEIPLLCIQKASLFYIQQRIRNNQ